MIRKVALAVALAVGSLPFSAFGLGLGEINTYSSLNQDFKADIQLYSVPKGELDGVRVKLASTDQFTRAGVDRYFFLTGLRFETIRQADGSAIIRVTSTEPIREPFLDFLVEVHWPKGNMVKEYTVLLDPPTTTSRRPQAVKQATTPRATSRPAAKPVASRAPAPRQRGTEPAASQYGPVAANETMWNIADALRPGGVTVHQMMMAMQDANPSAFINGNINLLKKGVILRVPSRNELLSVDNKAATSDFTRQTQDWMSGSPTKVAGDADKALPVSDSASSGMDVTAAEESDARLEIATTDITGAAGTGADVTDTGADVDQQLIAARENAESARQEAGVLEGEVSDLKDQVEDLQRLLALKDKQLAQLQANVAGAEPEEVMEAVPDDSEVAEVTPDPGEVVDETVTDETVMVAEEEVTEPEPSAAAVEEEAAAEDTPAESSGSEMMAAAEPAKELAWLDRNLPAVLGFGFAGLIGFGALMAFLRRNKYKDEQWEQTKREMEESMLLADTQDIESVLSEIVDIDEESNANDTSFLSEYSTEELRTLQEDTSEADPLSEADVYVAYGRYQQAQDLLEAALVEQPERAAIKHKMLEIHYATQDKKAFFALAKEMMDAGQDKADLPAWEQVTVMAADLDPSNSLLSGGGADLGETIGLSELAEDLESKLQDDSQPTESMGLDSIEIGGSRLSPDDTQAAEDAIEFGSAKVGGDDTELHTEMQDASVLTEFTDADTESLEDELAELEGDLDDLMVDPDEVGEDLDAEQLAEELADMTGGAGDSIIAGESGDDTETLGISEFTEPTTEIEVETKLELAQAYIDMGDKEGAQEIIQEILAEGTDDQVSRASELKTSLDG